ncbi:MAG: hydrogenase maturation protease [Thermoanaerobaculia bacterium]
MEPAPALVRVIGLGSLFRGDDALGTAVVAELRKGWDFPEGVRVTDGGTPGLDLLTLLSGSRHAVLVDAVASGSEPGSVRTYSREEWMRQTPGRRLSAHSLDLRETLLLLEAAGQAPETVTLVGVEPERVGTGIGLTATVRDAVPAAAEAVVEALTKVGSPPARRAGVR